MTANEIAERLICVEDDGNLKFHLRGFDACWSNCPKDKAERECHEMRREFERVIKLAIAEAVVAERQEIELETRRLAGAYANEWRNCGERFTALAGWIESRGREKTT